MTLAVTQDIFIYLMNEAHPLLSKMFAWSMLNSPLTLLPIYCIQELNWTCKWDLADETHRFSCYT